MKLFFNRSKALGDQSKIPGFLAKKLSYLFLLIAILLTTPLSHAEQEKKPKAEPAYILSDEGYLERPELEALIQKLENKPGLGREKLTKLFASVQQKKSILEAISRPAERRLNWAEYRKIFIRQSRIDAGVTFWKEHHETLHRASQTYNVPPEIIVAIIGVETQYGKFKGNYRVIDALSTLGFDYPPRSKFFFKELEAFLLLEDYAGISLEQTMGSYAGAMGYGQFIPSSYRHYAVDFDDDGVIDLINNPVDAIGSVANYFKKHGWQAGKPIAERSFFTQTADHEQLEALINIKGLKPKFKIKDLEKFGLKSTRYLDPNMKVSAYKLTGAEGAEHWLGLENFYVITRYNHSKLYAMAVFQLSELIKLNKDIGLKTH